MTKTVWYRVALVVVVVILIGVLYGLMQQEQISNPFLVGSLGLILGVDLALLLANLWPVHHSRKP